MMNRGYYYYAQTANEYTYGGVYGTGLVMNVICVTVYVLPELTRCLQRIIFLLGVREVCMYSMVNRGTIIKPAMYTHMVGYIMVQD